MPIPNSETSEEPTRRAVYAAVVWLVIFLVAFFGFDFSNDPPVSRWQLWPLVLELIDFLFPLPALPGHEAGARAVHSGWQYFSQRFDLLAVATIILAGAWGAGSLLLRILRLPLPPASLEHMVFAYGTGLSALSLATLGAGYFGVLSRPLLGSLLGLAVTAELALRYFLPPSARGGGGERAADPLTLPSKKQRSAELCKVVAADRPREFGSSPHFQPTPLSRGHWLILATLIPFLLAMLLGALLPSTDFDVNEYHFEGPKEFFQAGRISFLEYNVYTSFPFGTEMLTLLAMVLEGDWYRGALAGKGVLMCFGPLTGLALFAAGRRWFGNTAGVLAAVLYLSTPWIYRISTIAYAEGGLCFFLFASLLALMIANDESAGIDTGPFREGDVERRAAPLPDASGATTRPVMLAGFLAGSAMACKYPGLISVVIPLLVLTLWLAVRHRGKARWILPCGFLLGTLIAIGPWLAKNAVETGNPVYPLAYRLFGGRDWNPGLEARWQKAHSPDTFSPQSLVNLAIEVAVRSKWNNPLLFAFAPLALVAARTRRRAGWLWLYVGWLFLSCWLFTHRIDRFWVPLLPVVALLAGVGAAWFWEALKRGMSGLTPVSPEGYFGPSWLANFDRLLGLNAVIIPFVAIGLFNLELIAGWGGLCGYNDFLRDLDEAEQTATQVTCPEIVWLNHSLPSAPGVSSKVLVVGDAEMFYARFPVVYNTVFDRSYIEEWCAAPGEAAATGGLRDAATIRKKLAEEGITHVYVNWLEILRYRSPGNYGYTEFVTPELFSELRRLGILGPALPIPHAAIALDRLSPSWRGEVQTWGKALMLRSAEGPAFITFQVYPVVRQSGP